MVVGSFFAFREVPPRLGLDLRAHASGLEVVGILVGVILIEIFLIYLADVVWLLLARIFFTKGEVSKVVFAGPTSRFDRWLLNAVFGRD